MIDENYKENVIRRLLEGSVVDVETGCRVWLKSRNQCGCGVIRISGKTRSAHSAAYEVWVGQVPRGHRVYHLCDNNRCIRTEHLMCMNPTEWARTHRRAPPQNLGADNPSSKLTVRGVRIIRGLLEKGAATRRDMAERFSVSKSTIDKIANRTHWGHID